MMKHETERLQSLLRVLIFVAAIALSPFKVSAADSAVSGTPTAGGKQCPNMYGSPQGKIMDKVERFDKLLGSLGAQPNRIKALNDFLKMYGLPLTASSTDTMAAGGIKGYPDRIDVDSIGGPASVIYLKKLRTDATSGLGLDTVYEVKDAGSKSPLRKWSVPYNCVDMFFLRGDELIFKTTLFSGCSDENSQEAWLAVRPDGNYRVIEEERASDPPILPREGPQDVSSAVRLDENYRAIQEKRSSDPDTLPIEKCRAKELFGETGYAQCATLKDRKSGKKRVIVWQRPMT